MIDHVLLVVPPLVPQGDDDEASATPEIERRRLVSPIEPATIAADLRRRGFLPSIFDIGVHGPAWRGVLADRLAERTPDAIVLVPSILTFATAQEWDGAEVFMIGRAAREDVVTVLCGAHATNKPGAAVTDGTCDYAIRGEPDLAVGMLMACLRDRGDPATVAGVAFLRPDDGGLHASPDYPSVDPADLPPPAYHLLDPRDRHRYSEVLEIGKIRYPARGSRYRDIMTSRSCVLRCSFCSVAHLRGPRQTYRRKPLDAIVAEIEQALEDGIEEIHFFDDLFASTQQDLDTFIEALKARNLSFPWFVAQGFPLWPLTRDSLAGLAETGMYRLICPFESGNDRVLANVTGKVRSTVRHHHDVIDWASGLGLEIIGMFVVGMPEETRGDILDTLTFAESRPEIDYSVFSIATPMAGTKLMRTVTRDGRLEDAEVVNRVIKRTVALYRTAEFAEYELGIIRAYDWDRINFGTEARRKTYASMVGLTLDQLDDLRAASKATFHRFFPDYDGPLSFRDLVEHPALVRDLAPRIPETLS